MQQETFGQYLRRNMAANGIRTHEELEAALETFSRHRFGYRERFTQPSISQWLRDQHFPAENKRVIMGEFFGERYPDAAVIEAMRRLLRAASLQAA